MNGERVDVGETLSIDGTSGDVIRGTVHTTRVEPIPEIAVLLQWADEVRDLNIRANADTADEAKVARVNGAEGIGLCRTEHMFLDEQRLPIIRKMILAASAEQETQALQALRDSQHKDFIGLLEEMDGLPVTVRLLDPPLHEFLPEIEGLIEAAARNELDQHDQDLLRAARRWRERTRCRKRSAWCQAPPLRGNLIARTSGSPRPGQARPKQRRKNQEERCL